MRTILSRRMTYLLVLPAAIFIGLFLLYPFFSIIFISFTNRTLVGATALNPEFVGFDNYIRLFDFDRWMSRGELGWSLFVTFQFVIGSALIGQAGIGLFVAWIFHNKKGITREIVYTAAIAAWIIPEVVVAFAWFAFLNPEEGTLNMIFSALGLGQPDWLLDYPMLSIIVFNTWRGAAFSMLLFSSALSSIPPSYLETADVIGASTWQKFRDIILPSIRTYIMTDLILITLWTFNTFTPFLLTGGGPAFKTEVVSIYTYRTGLQFFQLGKGSAIAVIVMMINLLLASTYLFLLRSRAKKS